MAERILSISGLRGIIGDGLDPGYIVDFAAAIGTMIDGGSIVVARDGRTSGEMLKHAVLSALMATGCKVFDADIATTPTCGFLVKELGADAGLQITASHNPIPWNGLKPFSPNGSVFNEGRGKELLALLESRQFAFKKWDGVGSVETIADAAASHLERVCSLVDVEAIRRKRFKVVLDCNHGSGGVAGPSFLESLGCDVVVLGGTPDGKFEHVPEPLEQNLTHLSEVVKYSSADVGFAQDPDADRMAIVDGNGKYIGEELTLALAVDFVLPKRPGPVVVNGSTSRVNEDLAKRHGCEFHRSAVGEAHVGAMMQQVGATIGGEGNGGVIEPLVGYVRDSFTSMAYALGGMAERGTSLAAWVDELPKYTIAKQKFECPRESVSRACEALQATFDDARVTAGDGLRLDWSDRWVQVRASNTEPIIRVIAEAPDDAVANDLCDRAVKIALKAVSAKV